MSALREALLKVGMSKVAADCHVTVQAVAKWAAVERVPAERVLEVERLTGISRYELRPDVFGPAPPCDCIAPELPAPVHDQQEAA